ncbi:MAG: universal stress protein [Dehalococcoidia bacterium]|jgi:nucleotide-binding universal stress UspA family protein|nr:universal stress protein [Dehalococcoidia bacterium]
MFSRILVCLDGTSFSEQIVPYAVETARRFGSELILMTSAEIPTPAAPEYPIEVDLVQDLRRVEVDQYLEDTAARLREAGMAVRTNTAAGSPGHAIVEYAAQVGVDLIVMGTHGRKNIGRLVFGSVTDHVLKHTSVPVLVLKPHAKPETV